MSTNIGKLVLTGLIALSVVGTAATPAFARQGADDPADTTEDVRGGHGADDAPDTDEDAPNHG